MALNDFAAIEHSILRIVSLPVAIDEILCQCQELLVPAPSGEDDNVMTTSRAFTLQQTFIRCSC